MNQQQLDAIRARTDAATPGPWEWSGDSNMGCGEVFTMNEDHIGGPIAEPSGDLYPRGGYSPKEDMIFIAHAREDVPRLLDEIDCLQLEVNEAVTYARNATDSANKAETELAQAVAERNRLHNQLKHRQKDYRRTLHDVMECAAAVIAERDTELAEARRERNELKLVLAMHGGGADPEGFYAGTPGNQIRLLLAIRNAASDWRTEKDVGSERNLESIVDAYNNWYAPSSSDTAADTEPSKPCGTCNDARWVDDENWQPEPHELRHGRKPGAGRIPCGACNHGGWNEPDGQSSSDGAGQTADGEFEAWPAGRYMMATRASHVLGDVSRDLPDLAVVYSEDHDNYIGNWRTGFGFVNVRFPKDTTRELTAEEQAKYATRVVAAPGGFEEPALTGQAASVSVSAGEGECACGRPLRNGECRRHGRDLITTAEDDEPIDLDDLKRRAEALAPGVTDQLHNLLGCTWGDTIAIKGYSDDRCPSKAIQVVVLHQDGIERAFKLCGPHAELVKDETAPNDDSASVPAPAAEAKGTTWNP